MIASVDLLVLSRQWIGKFKPTVQVALSLYEALSPAHYTKSLKLRTLDYTDGTRPNNINIIGTKSNITKRY